MSSEGNRGDRSILLQHPDLIDMGAFAQILEMDDDEDMQFSSEICKGFIEEGKTIYPEIEDAIKRGDFETISSRAHYFVGLSRTIGAIKVIATSEELKRLGKHEDSNGEKFWDEERLLREAADVLVEAKTVYEETADVFRKFYQIDKD